MKVLISAIVIFMLINSASIAADVEELPGCGTAENLAKSLKPISELEWENISIVRIRQLWPYVLYISSKDRNIEAGNVHLTDFHRLVNENCECCIGFDFSKSQANESLTSITIFYSSLSKEHILRSANQILESLGIPDSNSIGQLKDNTNLSLVRKHQQWEIGDEIRSLQYQFDQNNEMWTFFASFSRGKSN